MAVAYLYAADLESAVDRMRATLTRFAGHHGVRGLCHETLTRFWMQHVERRLERSLCLCESVRRIREALPDKDLPFAYYRKETLDSPESRMQWVEPDLPQEDEMTV